MNKTYRIVDATINHPEAGVIIKQNIIYYIDGIMELTELYSIGDEIKTSIREGYSQV